MSGAAIQWMPNASHSGRQLAAVLGIPANEIAAHRFPDGELRVTVGPAASQRIVGEMLAKTFDRIVTVEAHLHRTATLQAVFPGIEADNLSAMPAVAAAARTGQLDPTTVLVGPDEESRSWVNDLAGLSPSPKRCTRRHSFCLSSRPAFISFLGSLGERLFVCALSSCRCDPADSWRGRRPLPDHGTAASSTRARDPRPLCGR